MPTDAPRAVRVMLLAAVLLAAVLLPAACVRDADVAKAPLGAAATAGAPGAAGRASPVMPAEGQAAIDAGNAAVRRKDYAAAQAAFEKAAKMAPDHAAPWFGLYIVAQARNDAKAADAALAEIRKRRD